jgi:hypothetical protein
MSKAKTRKHRGPSRASLREIPEIDFSTAEIRRNPYAAKVLAEGISIQAGRGRPRKGAETGPTVPRSVRFPKGVWKNLEKKAKAQGLPLHAALRAAVLAWLSSDSSHGSS